MSLATEHRPRTFAQVHGQQHVVLVLQTMLSRYRSDNVRIPAGIMLSGPRGSGKTTSARIIAASLNCTSPTDQPCGACVQCQSVYRFTSDAVVELDGATSGGAEQIRELGGKVRLSHSGNYRVVIIDECHAMSPQGFSALLKQLEEPPSGVLYILVTTDFHDVPPTITSRCLTFMFNTVQEKHIVSRLREICAAEQFVVDETVLALIARRANGALRDAAMLLEQLAVMQDFSVATAEKLWPDKTHEFVREFLRTAMAADAPEGMKIIQAAFNSMRDCGVLMDSLARRYRELVIAASGSEKPMPEQVARFSALIRLLWDFRIGTRNANLADPTPLEGLWFITSNYLNREKVQGAPKTLLEQQLARKAAAGGNPTTNGTQETTAGRLSAATKAVIVGAPAPPKPSESALLASLNE